jgi:hypothetical protein
MVAAAAALTMAIALGAGWFKLVPLGLGFCALAWVLAESSALLGRIESEPRRPRLGLSGRTAFGWILDAIMVVLAGWGAALEPWQPLHDRYFPAFMLVALLRILPRSLGPHAGAWLEDRALLAFALAGATLSGMGSEAIHVAAVAAALAGILLPGLATRLTRP